MIEGVKQFFIKIKKIITYIYTVLKSINPIIKMLISLIGIGIPGICFSFIIREKYKIKDFRNDYINNILFILDSTFYITNINMNYKYITQRDKKLYEYLLKNQDLLNNSLLLYEGYFDKSFDGDKSFKFVRNICLNEKEMFVLNELVNISIELKESIDDFIYFVKRDTKGLTINSINIKTIEKNPFNNNEEYLVISDTAKECIKIKEIINKKFIFLLVNKEELLSINKKISFITNFRIKNVNVEIEQSMKKVINQLRNRV